MFEKECEPCHSHPAFLNMSPLSAHSGWRAPGSHLRSLRWSEAQRDWGGYTLPHPLGAAANHLRHQIQAPQCTHRDR